MRKRAIYNVYVNRDVKCDLSLSLSLSLSLYKHWAFQRFAWKMISVMCQKTCHSAKYFNKTLQKHFQEMRTVSSTYE
jgi:hypothetical protein